MISSNLDAADDHQNVRSGAQQHYEEQCSQEAVTGHLRWAQLARTSPVFVSIFKRTAIHRKLQHPTRVSPGIGGQAAAARRHPTMPRRVPPLPHFRVVNRATSRDAAHIAVATKSQRSTGACWSWITARKFELSFKDMARRSLECSP